jgi:hypothetical protein
VAGPPIVPLTTVYSVRVSVTMELTAMEVLGVAITVDVDPFPRVM